MNSVNSNFYHLYFVVFVIFRLQQSRLFNLLSAQTGLFFLLFPGLRSFLTHPGLLHFAPSVLFSFTPGKLEGSFCSVRKKGGFSIKFPCGRVFLFRISSRG
jgi:hypothetical protein